MLLTIAAKYMIAIPQESMHVTCQYQVQLPAKALVPPSQGCVDDVLSITTYSDKAAIGVVPEAL